MPLNKRLAALVLGLLICFSSAAPAAALTVDFPLVRQLNQDTVGWIYQPDSGLNCPVLRHEEDEWYHERGFDGFKIYQTGSVYVHADASLDDRVVTVFGQAREEGSLSVIPQWKDPSAVQRDPFWLLTPDGTWQATVFACVMVEEGMLDEWYPPANTEEAFDEWLARVKAESLLTAPEQNMPAVTDRLMFIAARHLSGRHTLVMTRLTPAEQEAHGGPDLVKLEMDSMETRNGWVEMEPFGRVMVYAQNDPLYEAMRYESDLRQGNYRDFGGGGCGPTAMAIIVASLLDMQQLPQIRQYARNGIGSLLCPCSVNRVYCNHTHVPYCPETPEEYLRYLPVVLGDFAAGNNTWEMVARRVNSAGTNIKFANYVLEVYGLQSTPVDGLDEGLELMKEGTGKGLLLTAALRGSPFTNSSHFVVIAGVDGEYLYVIDPLRRTEAEYAKTDKREILELLAPGVTRIRLEDYGRSDLSPVCYIERPAQ